MSLFSSVVSASKSVNLALKYADTVVVLIDDNNRTEARELVKCTYLQRHKSIANIIEPNLYARLKVGMNFLTVIQESIFKKMTILRVI